MRMINKLIKLNLLQKHTNTGEYNKRRKQINIKNNNICLDSSQNDIKFNNVEMEKKG